MDPKEALRRVGLEDHMDHFPSQMSGGEQQRTSIARAIAKNPSWIFAGIYADEGISGTMTKRRKDFLRTF